MDKANAFNNYFHSVFTLDKDTLPNFPRCTDHNMAPFIFSLEEVRSVFKSYGSSYTISCDGFPVYLLSMLAGELFEPINTLFIMSLT